jgi:ATP-dependent RNA helicase DDX19/DBP5
LERFTGRTGRFGRKGISVNFVHNQKSFQDMMTIQQATGKAITKVETGDYDMMDEVSLVANFWGSDYIADI